jgi:hypothetical protein
MIDATPSLFLIEKPPIDIEQYGGIRHILSIFEYGYDKKDKPCYLLSEKNYYTYSTLKNNWIKSPYCYFNRYLTIANIFDFPNPKNDIYIYIYISQRFTTLEFTKIAKMIQLKNLGVQNVIDKPLQEKYPEYFI